MNPTFHSINQTLITSNTSSNLRTLNLNFHKCEVLFAPAESKVVRDLDSLGRLENCDPKEGQVQRK